MNANHPTYFLAVEQHSYVVVVIVFSASILGLFKRELTLSLSKLITFFTNEICELNQAN